MPTAGIVIIGDEILSGKFAEENAAFLIGELRALGVDLRRITFVPDDLEDIAQTVVENARRFDYVFTSGGVGPTHDDITMAAIAHGFGTTVMRHPDLEARVRGYWKDKLADANLRLADVPTGAELVYGKDQIWPVIALQNVYIMPGVPTLFRRKFVDIRDRFRASPVTAARLYVDVEEGELAPMLDAVVARYPAVKIGSYPRFSEKDFKVLVTLEGPSTDEVTGALEMLATSVGTRVVRREEPAVVGA
ncbi:MAG TPA: competence/damage-inducible protein A [Kofleriaceae bacterium]|nr:competence/damage-inducible protein A [Kofleriaceae bacterium]